MKVKPFYIQITDDMTPQVVQDVFDKCVDAGAVGCEGIDGTVKKHKYQGCYDINFNNFGVNKYNETLLHDGSRPYGGHEKEITLDQLDEWLGLAVEQEWNGEGLPPVGCECEKIFDGKSQIVTPLYYDDHKSGMVMFYYLDSGKSVGSDYDWCLVENCIFRKPETPEQKAERERLEAAYDLYCNAQHAVDVIGYDSFGVFKSDKVQVKFWLSIVDKTDYRKAK